MTTTILRKIRPRRAPRNLPSVTGLFRPSMLVQIR